MGISIINYETRNTVNGNDFFPMNDVGKAFRSILQRVRTDEKIHKDKEFRISTRSDKSGVKLFSGGGAYYFEIRFFPKDTNLILEALKVLGEEDDWEKFVEAAVKKFETEMEKYKNANNQISGGARFFIRGAIEEFVVAPMKEEMEKKQGVKNAAPANSLPVPPLLKVDFRQTSALQANEDWLRTQMQQQQIIQQQQQLMQQQQMMRQEFLRFQQWQQQQAFLQQQQQGEGLLALAEAATSFGSDGNSARKSKRARKADKPEEGGPPKKIHRPVAKRPAESTNPHEK